MEGVKTETTTFYRVNSRKRGSPIWDVYCEFVEENADMARLMAAALNSDLYESQVVKVTRVDTTEECLREETANPGNFKRRRGDGLILAFYFLDTCDLVLRFLIL